MTPEQYTHIKEQYNTRLARYFGSHADVTLLKEAPEKDSYGDIDMHIATARQTDWAHMAASIGAAAWLDRGSAKSQKCSIAVYLDGSSHDSTPVRYMMSHNNNPHHEQVSAEGTKEEYAQIDLEVVHPDLADWSVFYGSYGDMMAILGNLVTNHGFLVTDKGFQLRFQEFDDARKPEWDHFKPQIEDGRMILSTDMDAIMTFLGMSIEKYRAGFETRESLFLWLSECRTVSEHIEQRVWRPELSRDRQKEKRTNFMEFFHVWLPEHLKAEKAAAAANTGANQESSATNHSDNDKESQQLNPILQRREQLLQESLDFFGKRSEYDTKHITILRKRGNETALLHLKTMIAEHTGLTGSGLTKSVKAFRRHVCWDGTMPAIMKMGVSDADSQLCTLVSDDGLRLRFPNGVSKWVAKNHDRVRDALRQEEGRKIGNRDGYV